MFNEVLPNTLNPFCPEPSTLGKDQSLTNVKRHLDVPTIRQQASTLLYKHISLKNRGFFARWIGVFFMIGILGKSILFQTALAHDISAQGICFSIQEEDMKDFMIRQMRKKSIQKNIKEAFQHSIEQSVIQKKVSRLTRVVVNKTYFVDPTQMIDQQMIPNSPKKINPFDRVTFRKTLIFVDANDSDQMNWLKKGLTKWENNTVILVGGSLLEAQKTLGQKVFVDQTGELADYFHLKHVPAIVKESIEKKQWQVKEIQIN